MFLRSKIKLYEMLKYERNYLQATTAEIKTETYDLSVAAVRCPPKRNMKKEHLNIFMSHHAQK